MKEKIEEVVSLFGLVVNHDQWDEEGWLRIVPPYEMFVDNNSYKEYGVKIIYKDDGYDVIIEELRNFMFKLGEYQFKVRLNKLINL